MIRLTRTVKKKPRYKCNHGKTMKKNNVFLLFIHPDTACLVVLVKLIFLVTCGVAMERKREKEKEKKKERQHKEKTEER